MIKYTFNQSTCLYQFLRVIFVSAMCTFLVSAAGRGLASAVVADMLSCESSSVNQYVPASVCAHNRQEENVRYEVCN